jgi:hypothetical protein
MWHMLGHHFIAEKTLCFNYVFFEEDYWCNPKSKSYYSMENVFSIFVDETRTALDANK